MQTTKRCQHAVGKKKRLLPKRMEKKKSFWKRNVEVHKTPVVVWGGLTDRDEAGKKKKKTKKKERILEGGSDRPN